MSWKKLLQRKQVTVTEVAKLFFSKSTVQIESWQLNTVYFNILIDFCNLHGQSQNISHLPIFLGSTPNILPVWLHFWVQTWYWQGEHRRLHALVFISSSTITTITILIIACFYHMCVEGTTPARTQTSAIRGEPKSSCKLYLVAFLQKGATINPLLSNQMFTNPYIMISSLSDVLIVCPTVRAPTTRAPCLRLLWEGLCPWKSKDLL